MEIHTKGNGWMIRLMERECTPMPKLEQSMTDIGKKMFSTALGSRQTPKATGMMGYSRMVN
jgi:hypothetical protein